MPSIQLIDYPGRAPGYQARLFRDGKTVATKYFAIKKFGDRKARSLAKAWIAQMNASLPPMVWSSTSKGRHMGLPRNGNTSGVPGLRAAYLVRGDRVPTIWIHVQWTEGRGSSRRNRHTAYSVEKHGIEGATKLALDKRQEKTGIPQMSPRAAWLKLKKTL